MRMTKLKPELVPEPLWGISACSLLRPQSLWRAIRSDVLERAGHRCQTCRETTPPLYCHEQWRYEDGKGAAILTGFRIVCQKCNRAVHMGLAHSRGELPEALAQLRRVNAITEAEATRMFERASATWEKRSLKNWRVIVRPRLLKAFPQLCVLVGIDRRSAVLSRHSIPTIRL
jgi:hypothetical protein